MGKLTDALFKQIDIHGFVKNGRNWIKVSPPFHFIINLQSSKFNDDAESFTLNVAVFSTQIYELVWQKSAPVNPKETDSVFRVRISHFMSNNNKKDLWWELRQSEDIPAVLEQVNIALQRVMTFFKKLNDYNDLETAMQSLPKRDLAFPLVQIQLACIYYAMGNTGLATNKLSIVGEDEVWGDNAKKILIAIT